MSTGVRQKCRLLLEGREVPFRSATLMCKPNVPIIASIDVVPLQVLKFIRPRTQVHLLVSDTDAFGDAIPRLAFEGEVMGRGYGKSQDNRRFNLTAVDYSSYWDEAKAYYFNPNFLVGEVEETITNGPSPSDKAKAEGATSQATDATVGTLMVDLLLAPENGGDLVKGVVSVIKKLSDTNIFYRTAYDRLRIADRIRIFTSSNLAEFLKDIKLEEFLKGFSGKQGGLISLREMLLSIMQLVFHEFISVPFPSLLSNGTGAGSSIANFIFIPDSYALPPPKCNVIFPNQINNFEFTDDFRAAPTRYGYRHSLPEFISGASSVQTYKMQYYPDSMNDYMLSTKRVPSASEAASLLGASNIFNLGGSTFANAKRGAKKENAIGGVSLFPTLRHADFLTNDESLRGIFYETDTFAPMVTALAAHTDEVARIAFFKAIGGYMFFKKRFGAREVPPATLKFSPFLVPGFNCVLLDDSDAQQSVIAKLQSITHQFTHEGASTSVQLGYARDFEEVDALTGNSGEPPLPPWFDSTKFGQTDSGGAIFSKETAYLKNLKYISTDEEKTRAKITNATVFNQFGSFYQDLIGCDAITDANVPKNKSALVSMRGAVTYLTQRYRSVSSQPNARDAFVRSYTSRPIPKFSEAMAFLGASAQGGKIPEEFATFISTPGGVRKGRFDGKGFPDETLLKLRREIIDKYVLLLRTRRGFNG